MALLTWSEKYSVGVKKIDEQHTALVGTLNELHAAMLKGQAASVTGNLLRKLVEYTRNHFAAEEALMSRTGYPGLESHRTHHHELTRQVGEFVARYERGVF